ncbi:hypothetical protein RI844_04925 [Thalassotalea fonticola]|uniref:Uncharacterized protein n=1 Tax=Thalassotalea fonticola TaxID=3065649 RepID=A0ABZ0GRK1_9GAMM|nr:hypothetical protein RI844_04925 [Colwelliaceae bacterium S1-1]
MKYLATLCLIISFFSIATEDKVKAVKLDDTALCYPSAYSPNTSFMKAYLEPIKDQLDSSEGQELIYIPAQAIKAKVPEYTISHINKHGVDFEHKLTGLAYAKSQIGNPQGMAESAWNIYSERESVYVEKDPMLPFTRVYAYHKPLFMWHLVKYPPMKKTDQSLPNDWYIGSCSESAGSFSCRQVTEYKSVHYEYELQAHDMHLRKEVNDAVKGLLSEWNLKCSDYL